VGPISRIAKPIIRKLYKIEYPAQYIKESHSVVRGKRVHEENGKA
jgi:hypothetical protein